MPLTPRPIPPICAAVRRLRAKLGMSPAVFARLIRTLPLYVTRFETGIEEPSRLRTRRALEREAMELGLVEEAALFAQPRERVRSAQASPMQTRLPLADPYPGAWIGTI